MHCYFVRAGVHAELHVVETPEILERDQRILIRTGQGVQLGEVITQTAANDRRRSVTARYLRRTTYEDDLILQRLERHKREAVEACRSALAESGSSSVLLDVDHSFDGATLTLHFLGGSDEIAETVTQQIVRQYESVVRSGDFARLLSEGCGPGCGTEEGGGCGTGCASCSLATHCGTR